MGRTRFTRGRKAARTKRKLAQTMRQGKGGSVADIALNLLIRSGKPMSITDLAARVIKVKKAVPGKNFTQNLGAALAGDSRFRRVSRGVYGISKGMRLSMSRSMMR